MSSVAYLLYYQNQVHVILVIVIGRTKINILNIHEIPTDKNFGNVVSTCINTVAFRILTTDYRLYSNNTIKFSTG